MKNSLATGQMALIAIGVFMLFIGLDLLCEKKWQGLGGIFSAALFLFLAFTAKK
jgi:hypothetical protein